MQRILPSALALTKHSSVRAASLHDEEKQVDRSHPYWLNVAEVRWLGYPVDFS
ncbi:MAG: hypothetical protein J0L94_16715 [Rhodothermia bacterium]|nr:hypothetical protein [Rhodothermia bacterium]